MKRFFLFSLLLLLGFSAYAQEDVIKFMGIPVDGDRATMAKALKKKGFKPYMGDSVLKGTYNDERVTIGLYAENGNVGQVNVIFDSKSKDNAISLFNNLVVQFSNNAKYRPIDDFDYYIPDNVDVFTELTQKRPMYRARYYQLPADGSEIENVEDAKKVVVITFRYSHYNKYTQEHYFEVRMGFINLYRYPDLKMEKVTQ